MVTKELLEKLETLGFYPKTLSTIYIFSVLKEKRLNISSKIETEISISNLLNEIQKWMRDKFDLACTSVLSLEDGGSIKYESIVYLNKPSYWDEFLTFNVFDTYEEALLDAIEDAIDIIETLLSDEYKSRITSTDN